MKNNQKERKVTEAFTMNDHQSGCQPPDVDGRGCDAETRKCECSFGYTTHED